MTGDPSIRRRRRTVEVASLVTRAMGAVAIAVDMVRLIGAASTPHESTMAVSMWASFMVLLAASALSVANLIRPEGRSFRLYGILQVVADTATTGTSVFLTEMYNSHTRWPILFIPIVIAAQRLKLAGTLVVWAATAGSMFGGVFMSDRSVAETDYVREAVSLLLVVAILTGAQSNAYSRQVTQLQLARRQLEYQARHDALTGLPNRSLFDQFAARLDGRALAVLLLDLNGFKQVNDTLGHAAGDAVLTETGRRIKLDLRTGDMTARLGGDEFVVLIVDADREIADTVADRLRASICRPVFVGRTTAEVGVSIGVACREAGATAGVTELTAAADVAMYREKELDRTSKRVVAAARGVEAVRSER